MAARTWKCQRVMKGVKCATINPRRNMLCKECGKRRPATKIPAHKAILNTMPYEEWVEEYGEVCGICGRKPTANRRLDRDHDHKTGLPRGLLCAKCNRSLPGHVDISWLERALVYLKRAMKRNTESDSQ